MREEGGHFLCSPFWVFTLGCGHGREGSGDSEESVMGSGGAEDDAAGEIKCGGVFGGAEGGVVAVHGGDAAEEELADVGDGDGVEARDAFAGELADEVAEEGVDGLGG